MYCVSYGRLHTLPYHLGYPAAFAGRLYHYPGLLFLRAAQERAAAPEPPQPALLQTDAALTGGQDRGDPIPLVLTDQAIADCFLPKPITNLQDVLTAPERDWHFTDSAFAGHGDQLGHLQAGRNLSWQEWVCLPIQIQQAFIMACLLGRTEDRHGDPSGWVCALLLRGGATVIAALAPISDFYSPLFSLLYCQARFTACDRKLRPEDALSEARRRLLDGDWYQPDEVSDGRATADWVRDLYPVGMRETVRLLQQLGPDTHQLLDGWHLPPDWRQWLETDADSVRDAVRADDGRTLIADTLDYMISNPAAIGHEPAVVVLTTTVICFGRSEATAH